jgi:hypothetical protein
MLQLLQQDGGSNSCPSFFTPWSEVYFLSLFPAGLDQTTSCRCKMILKNFLLECANQAMDYFWIRTLNQKIQILLHNLLCCVFSNERSYFSFMPFV